MSGLLDGLAADIAGALNGQLYAGTLRKQVPTGAKNEYGDPITTPVDYAVQGFLDTYSAIMIMAAGIPATDVKLVMIAGLCGAVPAIADKVMIGGKVYQLRNVVIDPAGATYTCQAFAVPS
jgi:hypothetical protein